MKKYLYLGAIGIFILLLCALYSNHLKMLKYKKMWDTELSNVRAYESENDSLKNNIRTFQYTIDALKTSKDTINQKIVQVIKEGGIKEKNVERVEYITSTIEKTDTITLQDTIFKESVVNVDTTIGDEWYNLDLQLQYPSTIITKPEFKSEKYIIASVKKEYVKPRSKWFFIRWFQKKRKYIGIDVIEKNPYIKDSTSRFIEIIK